MISYTELYQDYIFPFFEAKVKKRDTSFVYEKLIKSQWDSRDNLRKMQLDSLRSLCDFAYKHSIYYKKLFDMYEFKSEQISTFEDLLKLPILNKETISHHFDDLICFPFRGALWKKSTGGSTGQPLSFGYTKKSYAWRVAVSKRGYSWAGGPPGTKQAYIWGVNLGPQSLTKLWKEKIHHFIDRQTYFNCFNFGLHQMNECLSKLQKIKPHVIIGYTNPLYEFSKFLLLEGKQSIKPQGVITAAEKLHKFQRDTIEEAFGCKVFNTYGSREFMLIASECEKHEGLHVSMENLIVEIIKEDGTPAAPGELGKIIVTDLHNYGMPFIRYEIGDLGVVSGRSCSCGRGLELIDDIVGRSLDVIHLRDGRVLPGEFFPHLMKDFRDVKRFQVVQHDLNLLEVKIVPVGNFSEESMRKINEELRKVVGSEIKVEYNFVSDIPLTATGKHRVTISNCRLS